MVTRVFAADLATYIDREVTVKGWAKFVRNTKSTTFIVLQDVSGTVQLVGPADLPVHVKREDALEIVGRVREDQRAPRGLERVFETGHVYRAEPHATSRYLAEYYSLDFEMGFINGPEDVIEIERDILTEMFENVRQEFGERLSQFDAYLPSMLNVPIWTFDECLDHLKRAYGRTDLVDDLTPEAERQLCMLAEQETGVSAVFVLGFPLSGRPFYTYPRSDGRTAAGFDLLFRGTEITTGGQRLHRRTDLENALRQRGVDPNAFESHLCTFDLGMPPHAGLAIGAERLTAQVLGLRNVREATLYPRDVQRITP